MSKVASGKSKTISRIPKACADETAAVEFMESMRWDGEPACPRCGDTDVYQMRARATGERSARFLWRCRGCRRQYTVRVGTVMEDSPIPLRHWCFAFWAACSSKKGVSALQIRRQTGLSYKSALFLMHRIRFAMNGAGNTGLLSGDVEADETWVGGRLRKRAYGSRQKKRRGGFSPEARANKTPVMAIIERDGQVRAKVPTDVTGGSLAGHLRSNVDMAASRLHTDEWKGYVRVGHEFAGGHYTVKHKFNEYVRRDGDVTAGVNNCEAFFAILKRGVIGTFHAVSRKHLHRYVSEFEFRWNTRTLAARGRNGFPERRVKEWEQRRGGADLVPTAGLAA